MRSGVLAVGLSESERKKRRIEGRCFFLQQTRTFLQRLSIAEGGRRKRKKPETYRTARVVNAEPR